MRSGSARGSAAAAAAARRYTLGKSRGSALDRGVTIARDIYERSRRPSDFPLPPLLLLLLLPPSSTHGYRFRFSMRLPSPPTPWQLSAVFRASHPREDVILDRSGRALGRVASTTREKGREGRRRRTRAKSALLRENGGHHAGGLNFKYSWRGRAIGEFPAYRERVEHTNVTRYDVLRVCRGNWQASSFPALFRRRERSLWSLVGYRRYRSEIMYDRKT